jgi:carbonic anhydrase/acetyltransferase-like protein (isoleucine patch superfamily)
MNSGKSKQIRKEFMKNIPKIDNSAFIADGAKIMGDVTIGPDSSVWYNCVIRSDIPNTNIVIGEMTNIQDCTVIHNDHNKSTVIGNNVTIGHNCIIHGCVIEDECLIGMGAIVLSGALIKKGAVIGAGAVVKENAVIESNTLAVGIPAKQIKTLDGNSRKHVLENAEEYVNVGKDHAKGLFHLAETKP